MNIFFCFSFNLRKLIYLRVKWNCFLIKFHVYLLEKFNIILVLINFCIQSAILEPSHTQLYFWKTWSGKPKLEFCITWKSRFFFSGTNVLKWQKRSRQFDQSLKKPIFTDTKRLNWLTFRTCAGREKQRQNINRKKCSRCHLGDNSEDIKDKGGPDYTGLEMKSST